MKQLSEWGLRICSENNFPTAAGLASSASGFAALTFSLATLFALEPAYTRSELTRIARQGSGSACRSLMGGFVAWHGGARPDGGDSLAVEVAPREHWASLQALICVVSDAKKGTPSTAGMQRTVATSPLLAERIRAVVPARMRAITSAIEARDFDAFAQLTMADSNNFHACCLDTEPPIFYLNDTSRALIQLAEEINRASLASGGKRLVAYTYDAGPNAVLYHEKQHSAMILDAVRHYFPNADFDDTVSVPGLAGCRTPKADLASTLTQTILTTIPLPLRTHPLTLHLSTTRAPSSTSWAKARTPRTAVRSRPWRCPRRCRRGSTKPSSRSASRAPSAASSTRRSATARASSSRRAAPSRSAPRSACSTPRASRSGCSGRSGCKIERTEEEICAGLVCDCWLHCDSPCGAVRFHPTLHL